MNRTLRKRMSALLLTVCLLSSLCTGLTALAAEGVIEIGSAAEFVALTKQDFAAIRDAEIVLTADIDMKGKAAIAPIGGGEAFNGTFDGQGYVIRNLKITDTSSAAGLFGQVGPEGLVCDLGLENITVTAGSSNGTSGTNTGTVAGALLGTVTRCAVTGSVTGWRYTGGIAGMVYGGTIQDCWVDLDYDGSRYCGGLFGGTRFDTEYATDDSRCLFPAAPETEGETTIRNNLVMGTMFSHVRSAGLVGIMDDETASRPLAAFEGNVSALASLELEREEIGSNYYGPLYANWAESVTAVEDAPDNLYSEDTVYRYSGRALAESDTDASLLPNQASATAEELADQSTYEALGWDFDTVWEWDDALGHPVLQGMEFYKVNEVETVYINDVDDFLDLCEPDNFLEYSNDIIILTDDIDMEGEDAIAPIGGDEPFNGAFDGQGYAIRNLSITGKQGTNRCTGLFGYVGTEGRITDLGLDCVTVSGHVNTGVFAGCLTGEVSKCYATGTVKGMRYTGGVAGMLHGGTIENCWVDLDIAGSRYYGGLIGGTRHDTRYADETGNWTVYTPITEAIVDGAMVMRNNLTLGTLTGNRFAGGFLGDMANSRTTNLAAFEGNVSWAESVESLALEKGNSYYDPYYGKWVKSRQIPDIDYDNLYWDEMSLSGLSESIVSTDSRPHADLRIKAATAEELGLQETYEALGWDFEDTWVWDEDLGHPVLRGQTAPTDPDLQKKYPASLVTTYVGDPKTTRAFTWHTDDTVENTVIQWVPESRYEDEEDFEGRWATETEGDHYALEVLEDTFRHIHKVNLTGLEPGTTYYYRAGDGEHWSRVYSFTTERADADSFTFFSVTDTQDQYENYKTVLEHATENYPEGEFLLHTGDVIQNNITGDYDEVYKLTSGYVTDLPSMVTPGNHELNKDSQETTSGTEEPDFVKGIDNFNAHYQFPDNGPEGYGQTVYSFTYGDAYFAVLNSNISLYDGTFDDQITWLKADMEANGSDKAWQIVSIHHGPYNSSGNVTADAAAGIDKADAQALIDAMEAFGVDLVIFGHYHIFKACGPLKSGSVYYYSPGCSGGSPGVGTGAPIYAAITVTEDSLSVTSHVVPVKASDEEKVQDSETLTKPEAAVAEAPAGVEGLVYDGEEHTLITEGAAEAGVMLYSLDGETYSEALPAAEDAGTYTVYWKAGGIDHADTEPQTLEVTVAPRDITGAEVILGDKLTYNGEEQAQQVDSVRIDGMDVTFDVEDNTGTRAGSYTLTVIGTGNFTGEITVEWSIANRVSSITPSNPERDPHEEIPEEHPDADVPLAACHRDAFCPIHPFADASPAAWYHDGVHYCLEEGLMKGTGGSTFSPTGNITREQVWMMLARLSGEQPATMEEARDWAMANGVSDGTNPKANITREQLATMLFRYAKLMGYDVSVGEDTNILSYTDVFSVSEYAIPAMQWSCGAGVVGGFPDGTLRPLDTASRAEGAAMFQRFCESTVK